MCIFWVYGLEILAYSVAGYALGMLIGIPLFRRLDIKLERWLDLGFSEEISLAREDQEAEEKEGEEEGGGGGEEKGAEENHRDR